MVRSVTHDTLKHMGHSLSNVKSELKSGKKALNRLSRRAECAFTHWPWPENGATEPGCPLADIDPEFEDEFPLAIVSRSVNNILKSSYRKIAEQVAETERVRATVADVRAELDETAAACDGALEQIEKQSKYVDDLKTECTSLKEMVRTLELFKETVTAGERFSYGKHQAALERLGCLEREVELHKCKGELFDGLCQEVRMLPYGLRTAETATKCLDALRAWVKSKEGFLMGSCEDGDASDDDGANGDTMEVEVNGDVETSFTTCGSPCPASTVSDSLTGEEQY